MKVLGCVLLVCALSTFGFAGGTSCSNATVLVPDGRILDLDVIQPNSPAFYTFTAESGHSYSIEIRDDLDADSSDLTTPTGPSYWEGVACTSQVAKVNNGTYATYTDLQYNDTSSFDPVIGSHGFRISLPQPAAASYYIKITNNSTSTGHYVSLRVADTTLFSSRWTTNSNFLTSFAFRSTIKQTVNAQLTLLLTVNNQGPTTCSGTPCTTAGGPLAPFNFPIPGNITQFITAQAAATVVLPLLVGQQGYATLANDGPPGAITGDEHVYHNYVTSPATEMYWGDYDVTFSPSGTQQH